MSTHALQRRTVTDEASASIEPRFVHRVSLANKTATPALQMSAKLRTDSHGVTTLVLVVEEVPLA